MIREEQSKQRTQDRKDDHASACLSQRGGKPIDRKGECGYSMHQRDDVVPAAGEEFFFCHFVCFPFTLWNGLLLLLRPGEMIVKLGQVQCMFVTLGVVFTPLLKSQR